MLSAGNDIVDLSFIDLNRTADVRFYAKILSPEEEKYYSEVENKISFGHFVWLFWSIKESVYKYVKRFDHGLLFSPRKIIVNKISFSTETGPRLCAPTVSDLNFSNYTHQCEINYHGYFIRAFSIVNDFFISTFATGPVSPRQINIGIKKIPDSAYEIQREAIRTFALEKIKNIFPVESLKFDKHPAGFPIILKNNIPIEAPISFSHHGNFISYLIIN